jgi:hypothetical protein
MPQRVAIVVVLVAATATLCADTHYVNVSNAVPEHPHTNWAMAATVIQDAVDAATSGDLVLVTNGTYEVGNRIVADGLRNRVAITNAIMVKSLRGPEWTYIKGQGPNGDNAVRCVFISGGGVLSGFSLTNGHSGIEFWPLRYDLVLGGGVYVDQTGTVSECIITGNSAGQSGAGACLNEGGNLHDCALTGNHAATAGGGVLCFIGGTVSNCTIIGNSSDHFGGGVHLAVSGLSVNCIIRENRSSMGGGICCVSGTGTVYNCVVVSNSAGSGGGVHCDTGGVVRNSTITGNTAGEGGGVHIYRGGKLHNSIVFDNSATTNANWRVTNSGVSNFAYCCTTPSVGIACITNPPQFVDASTNDYRLQPGSPCVDAGAPGSTPKADHLGVPRPLDGNADGLAVIDIGAHEYIHPSADSDRDGVGDSDEMNQHGTSPVAADSDGDGSGDGHELDAGTDPLDPASAFIIHDERLDALSGDTVVSWSTVTGRLYDVVCSSNLTGVAWIPVPGCTNLPGNGDLLACTNGVMPPALFYRVVVRLP